MSEPERGSTNIEMKLPDHFERIGTTPDGIEHQVRVDVRWDPAGREAKEITGHITRIELDGEVLHWPNPPGYEAQRIADQLKAAGFREVLPESPTPSAILPSEE